MGSSLIADRRVQEENRKAKPIAAPRDGVDRLERVARAVVGQIRSRSRYLPEVVSEDPEWLMILELFIAAGSGRKVSVSNLCALSGVPSTTALRHIGLLEQKGVVARSPAPRDRRISHVRLDERAHRRLQAYLSAIAPRWLAGNDDLSLG